jgi:hypothetical protein
MMGGHARSFWSLAIATCQGGTTKMSSWPTGILPTCNPLTSGPTCRSTSKWLTGMLPIGI